MADVTDVTLDSTGTAVFMCWKVTEGTVVAPTSSLMCYKSDNQVKYVRSAIHGTVQTLATFNVDDELIPGQFLLKLRHCEHPVVMKDLCAACGMDLRRKEGYPGEREVFTKARVAMIHSIPELQITPDEAKTHGSADEANLLRQRKLVLLVDLDQTLIHTTNEAVSPNLKDVHHYQLYGSQSPWYHTRLRPHTRHFLEVVSKLYELHICTFGARLYAHTVAKILDPDSHLFSHRILSRDECFDANSKTANLKALFPCGDRLVCIIDDREDVWNYAPNVVHVKPYRFFKNTGDINAPPGFAKNGRSSSSSKTSEKSSGNDEITSNDASPLESDQPPAKFSESVELPLEATKSGDETGQVVVETATTSSNDTVAKTDSDDDDDDDYLYYLEEILARIHTAFYDMHDQLPKDERPPDMRSVVPYVKLKVLKNVNLVFSGVVPTRQPIQTSAIYKAAVSFGATVQDELVWGSGDDRSKRTTHLVAARWGTAKVHQARRQASTIKIVAPQWLWCCVERWEHVDERLFPLVKDNSKLCKSAAKIAESLVHDADTIAESYMDEEIMQPISSASKTAPHNQGSDGVMSAIAQNSAGDGGTEDIHSPPEVKRQKMDNNETELLQNADSDASSVETGQSTNDEENKDTSDSEDGAGTTDSSGSIDMEMAKDLEEQFQ